MAKQLIILRHSKTEKINPAGDLARELTKPGRRWAMEAGREILEAAGMPDLLVTSNAIRALQTGDLAAEAMKFDGERLVRPGVYGATENQLIEVIQSLPEEFSAVVLVGHNPGLEELANSFRAEKKAWAFFSAQPPGYRRLSLWHIVSAKQEATRERRLVRLITASAAGRRLA